VVDREEEEGTKEVISLWKKQGKVGEGKGVILTRRRIVRRLYPNPLLHWCHYGASDTVSDAKPSKTMRLLSITWEGEGLAMMSGPLISGNSQTAAPFQFPFIY
jgi:hypothetical protein